MTHLVASFAGHPNFEAYRLFQKDFHDQHVFLFENELQASVITIQNRNGFELMVRDWTGEIVMTDEIFGCGDAVIDGLSEDEVLTMLEVIKNWKDEPELVTWLKARIKEAEKEARRGFQFDFGQLEAFKEVLERVEEDN